MSILMEIYIAGAVSSAEIFRSEESGSLSPDTQHISMHYFSAAASSFPGVLVGWEGGPKGASSPHPAASWFLVLPRPGQLTSIRYNPPVTSSRLPFESPLP